MFDGVNFYFEDDEPIVIRPVITPEQEAIRQHDMDMWEEVFWGNS